jgi:peptide/nickel transport system permease protein
MPRWFTRIVRQVGSLAATVMLGGILTGMLVRTSPGFTSDERLLDPRLDAASRAAIEAEHAADGSLLHFFERHTGNILRGDWGVSPSLHAPIAGLIRSRLRVTAELMAIGIAGGWLLAFGLALAAVLSPAWGRLGGALSVTTVSIPAAALAVLLFCAHGPVRAIIALILFPRLFDYLRNLLADAYAQPHIVLARAKGVGPIRLLAHHILPVCAPQFLALAGISAGMAFGAAIPVETLSDLPGIGQLAWKAAIARDLPVLVTLTLLITLLTHLCNSVADWVGWDLRGARP